MAKSINFYLKNGFLNVKKLLSVMKQVPFLFATGGRNIGKTYGVVKYLIFGDDGTGQGRDPLIKNIDFDAKLPWDENVFPFMFLRRTQAQADAIANEQNNILSKILLNYFEDTGQHSDVVVKFKTMSMCKCVHCMYLCDKNEEGEYEINEDKLICYITSIKAFGTKNGVDMPHVNLLLLDEFQRVPGEDKMSREAERAWNIYKSVQRDRIRRGRPALRFLFLSNANELNNPYYKSYKCIDDVVEMGKIKQVFKKIRHFGLVLFYDSPISEYDAENDPLYDNLNGGDDRYAKMAVNNEFKMTKSELVKPRNLGDCRPICSINDITFYEYKERGESFVYVSYTNKGGRQYGGSKAEHMRFAVSEKWLWEAFLNSYMRFESYGVMCNFHDCWDLSLWEDV